VATALAVRRRREGKEVLILLAEPGGSIASEGMPLIYVEEIGPILALGKGVPRTRLAFNALRGKGSFLGGELAPNLALRKCFTVSGGSS